MISRLGKFIAIEYLKTLFFTLLFIIMLFYVIDLLEHLDNFYNEGAPTKIIVQFYLLKTPEYIVNFLPFALLISAVVLLVIRSKFNETIALFSSGISLFNLMTPILTIAISCTLLSFFMSETLIPKTSQAARDIEATYIQKRKRAARFIQNRYWLKVDNGIVSTQLLDEEGKKALGFTYIVLDDRGKFKKRYDAREARYQKNWELYGVKVLSTENNLKVDTLDHISIFIDAPFDAFYSSQKSPSDMNSGELRKYINELQFKGYDANRFRVDYYSRFSNLALNIIIIFLAAPFAISGHSRGAIIRGIAISVILAFGCWVLFSASLSLGRKGSIDPLIASWLPNIIVGGLAYLTYRKMRV